MSSVESAADDAPPPAASRVAATPNDITYREDRARAGDEVRHGAVWPVSSDHGADASFDGQAGSTPPEVLNCLHPD